MMNKQTIKHGLAGNKAKPAKTVSAKTVPTKVVKRTGGNGNTGRADNGGRGAGSKKAQLVALLSRKGGARLSVISERLGWQAHTVRAAISGLRKQGFDIATSKAPHPKNSRKSSATDPKAAGNPPGNAGTGQNAGTDPSAGTVPTAGTDQNAGSGETVYAIIASSGATDKASDRAAQ